MITVLLWVYVFFTQNDDKCAFYLSKIREFGERSVRANFAAIYKNCPETALTIPCFLPLKDFEGTQISSGFGVRKHPIKGILKHHNGIDISSPVKEVVATASGIVQATGYDAGLGNYVIINHQNSYQTTYGHLSKILVQEGQKITILETLGVVGSTGASTGNHIHYEIRKNGILVNPIEYLLLVYFI